MFAKHLGDEKCQRGAMGCGDTARDGHPLAKSRAGMESRMPGSQRARPGVPTPPASGGGGREGRENSSRAARGPPFPPASRRHTRHTWEGAGFSLPGGRLAAFCRINRTLAPSWHPLALQSPKKIQESRHGGAPPCSRRGYREVTKPIY